LLLLSSAVTGACASGGGVSPDLPPYAYSIPASADSALTLLRASLAAERVSVEAATVEGARTLRGSFVVRRGGVGEAEVFVTGRVSEAGDASSRLELDVTVRERRRSVVIGAPDARAGSRPEVTTVNPNDRETLGVLSRVRDRLVNAGAVRLGRTG
jgi:hypothetical protein